MNEQRRVNTNKKNECYLKQIKDRPQSLTNLPSSGKVFPVPMNLGWPVTSLTNTVWWWPWPLTGCHLLPSLLEAWAAILNKSDYPDGETTQSCWDTSVEEEAWWTILRRWQACGWGFLDTPDQSNHLLNTIKWPDSSHHRKQENCLDEPVLNFWSTTSLEIYNSYFKSLKVWVVCHTATDIWNASFHFLPW